MGSALAIVVYAGAHISSAHYNPAVSLSVFTTGELTSCLLYTS
ncbi:MAG: aquaporin, partial [Ignavibacteria bacterium]|nr:aquaporin [Ignavibacteria bacterium]